MQVVDLLLRKYGGRGEKMLSGNNTVIKITGISSTDEEAIKHFLQGAVYTWCNIKETEHFLFRNLMGGGNYFWNDTPLCCLYDKYKNSGKDEETAVEEAGKDAGMLLKSVLKEDKNKTFNQGKKTENGIVKNMYWLA
jgi:hypothetical protein